MTHLHNMKDNVQEQARAWVIHLHSGTATEADKQTFRAWLKEAPQHPGAFAQAEQFWRDLAMSEALAPESGSTAAARLRRPASDWKQRARWAVALLSPRPVQWGLAASVLLLIGIGAGHLLLQRQPVAISHYATAVGELRDIELADGSKVLLGARSTLTFSSQPQSRRVQLSGQAFFDVASAADRPFIVTTPHTRVTVTGTAFDINTGVGSRVAVLEGTVTVATRTIDTRSRIVTAGQQVIADTEGNLGEVEAIKGPKPGSWRGERLSYEDVPLAQLVADANRYYAPGIVIENEAIKSIRVNVSFRTSQVADMISGLASSHGLEVKTWPDGSIRVFPHREPREP